MKNIKTEKFSVSFAVEDLSYDTEEVVLTCELDGHSTHYTSLPVLAMSLCNLIEVGGMSKQEAAKVIAKAMLYLN